MHPPVHVGCPRSPGGTVPRGFTMIELLIVVAVVAILARIAMPNFNEQIKRAARGDAQSTLLEAAQYLERVYSECNAYNLRDASTNPPCTTAVTGLPATIQRSPKEGTQRYTISLSTFTANSFVIDAAPLTTDACGTFRISSNGVRALVGNTRAFNECWRR